MIDPAKIAEFVRGRIASQAAYPNSPGIPTAVAILAQVELTRAAEFPDFFGGYASASEDALEAVALMWQYHPDYAKLYE